jgi:hypothetical protein
MHKCADHAGLTAAALGRLNFMITANFMITGEFDP